MSHPSHNPQEPSGPSYGYPGHVPPQASAPYGHPGPPVGPLPPVSAPPRQPLSRGQRVGLGGCAIVVGGFVALVIAALALGPETVVKVKEKPVPGPTVTAAGPTVTVTASPNSAPPGIPQLTGGTWKDAQARTVKLEARSPTRT
ncbi:hypothetical protein AB0P15_33580 [Streptomyces sp. NPDC087917]|uniref:hypothetical protein n=1 Tax=Streptomyces sp. NPDC087917 TaxID=3155060 RepID=UPI0034488407